MVECKICGKEFKVITNTHLKLHNVTSNEYIKDFNLVLSDWCSEESRKRYSHIPWNLGLTKETEPKLRGRQRIKNLILNKCLFCGRGTKNTKYCSKVCGGKAAGFQRGHKGYDSGDKQRGILKPKTSGGLRRYFENPENKQKVRQVVLKLYQENPERFDNFKTCNKMKKEGLIDDTKRKENVLRALKERWSDPEKKARIISKTMKSNNIKPNTKEILLQNILDEIFPLTWEFIGDGKLFIGGKCPDFWNGDHKLIELYGDYWHKGEEIQVRIKFFEDLGYNTLVIWESELEDKGTLISKLKEFN